MPVSLLFDPAEIDFGTTQFERPIIEKYNRHRGEAVQIDRIVWMDEAHQRAVATRRIRDDEWWCPGHIPERAIFPAVLMVEASAQLASFMFMSREMINYEFVGFTRIDETVFRSMVGPGDELVLLAREVKFHIRRFICRVQGIKPDGEFVFETKVTGMPLIE